MRAKPTWKRCWHGKVPKAEHLLIYDDAENVTLVDTRREHFAEHWLATKGTRIKFYIRIPRLPYRTAWLFNQETVGRVAA